MSGIPVLLYHIVDDDNASSISISVQAFSGQIAYLRNEGYRTVSLAEFVAVAQGRIPTPTRAVMITFDDGYEDVYTRAAPLLRKSGYSAAIFLLPRYMGQLNWWNRKASYLKRHLDWDQAGELAREGFELGAHTLEHHSLVKLPEEMARSEIKGSQQAIEERLGHRVRAFAYPYGDSNPLIERLVAESFDIAFSVTQGRQNYIGYPFQINRLEPDNGWTMERFAAAISWSPC